MIKNQKKDQQIAGFTLFEMTVVMIIAGIVLALLGATLLAYNNENRIKTTEIRSEEIQKALSRYLVANGRYPCVARRDLGADDAAFGREITTICNAGNVTGTVNAGNVRIGAVPTRTLNLPDTFAADGWGRKFTFAVTKALATNGSYRSDSGVISIVNSSNVVFFPSAHYVIVSHGATGIGARAFTYENSGTAIEAVPCTGAGLDAENCNDNEVFMSTLINTTKNDPAFFDDYVFYKGLTMRGLTKSLAIPTGAVMPFNSTTCPAGWTRFFWGEKKFIIGTHPVGTITRTRYQMLKESDTTSSVTLGTVFPNATQSSNGDSQKGNIPPYVALLYCEKLPY